MRATDAVVRRTQERTLAISTRLVAADHATAFAVPIAEPLPKDAVKRREGAVDEEVAPELRRRCAEWARGGWRACSARARFDCSSRA